MSLWHASLRTNNGSVEDIEHRLRTLEEHVAAEGEVGRLRETVARQGERIEDLNKTLQRTLKLLKSQIDPALVESIFCYKPRARAPAGEFYFQFKFKAGT